ncbi:nuclear protein Es2-domain-containing protein [Mycotypha africana]|uniref:nuclear protein Es2-domain-containing protein n=1 Tax=Mycotypha africana TaxID=64632 RepID=UPI002300CF02|nr:nuclear protein Es2-domain-containing protein [Mycotypha africana]KAI8973323.1 nuclear protein Es2-domain-containing protein [Mycotypha africana]
MATPVVLDEDTYTEAISLIIERDFFPVLAKLKATQQYHAAVENGSLADLTEAQAALQKLNQPASTIPDRNHKVLNFYVEDESDIRKRVNLNLSLDQFQTLYTSEDNASFKEILDKANEKVRLNNKWFFDRESNRFTITNGEEGSKPKLIEANEKAPAGWKYQARNALMYYPQGESKSWIHDDKDARGAPKSISYENTHIPDDSLSFSKDNTASAPSDTAVKRGTFTPWSQLNRKSNDEEGEGSTTPHIRGYNLVPSTPALSPSRAGTPDMTWGSIEGTPLLINNGSQTPAPQFSLPKISRREELGMKLSEKASKAYRKKTNEQQRLLKNSGGTPRLGAGMKSPAAQHLLRMSSVSSPLARSGFGQALRNSYRGNTSTLSKGFKSPYLGVNSPSALRRAGKTPTPLFRAGATAGATPKASLRKSTQNDPKD